MSKLSVRWMVITAMGLLASSATAQPSEPTGEPAGASSDAKPESTSTIPKDTKKVDYGSGIPEEPSASAEAAAPNPASAVSEPLPETQLKAATSGEDNKPWMQQLLPTDGMIELGAVTGLLFPSRVLNLQSQTAKHQHLATAPELGVRVGYFPIKYLGGEIEYVAGFSKTEKDNQSATTVGPTGGIDWTISGLAHHAFCGHRRGTYRRL